MIPRGCTQVRTVMRGKTGTRFGQFGEGKDWNKVWIICFSDIAPVIQDRCGGRKMKDRILRPTFLSHLVITVLGISVPHTNVLFRRGRVMQIHNSQERGHPRPPKYINLPTWLFFESEYGKQVPSGISI